MKAGVKKHNMYDAPSGIPPSGANIRLRFVGFKKKICIAFTQTEVLTGRWNKKNHTYSTRQS